MERLRNFYNPLDLIAAETPLEKAILLDSEVQAGLNYGRPRRGHPEGKTLFHVQELLQMIDNLGTDSETRAFLRVAAMTHDSFKHLQRERQGNHADLAADFLDRLNGNLGRIKTPVQAIVRYHDYPFRWWRQETNYGREVSLEEVERVLEATRPYEQLFITFVQLDMSVPGKNEEVLAFFEKKIKEVTQSFG